MLNKSSRHLYQVAHIIVIDVVEGARVVDLEVGGRVAVLVVLHPPRAKELVKDLQAAHGARDAVTLDPGAHEHGAAEAGLQEVGQ